MTGFMDVVTNKLTNVSDVRVGPDLHIDLSG